MLSPRSSVLLMLLAVLAVVGTPTQANAHCQVPCGTYDDHARGRAMLEDAQTIGKAVTYIAAYADSTEPNKVNQVTRWVATKEAHASRVITTIAEYFLTQKIAPADPRDKAAWAKYAQILADHHKVMRLAMKAKQTVSAKGVAQLRDAIAHLTTYWPAPKKRH